MSMETIVVSFCISMLWLGVLWGMAEGLCWLFPVPESWFDRREG